MFSWLSKRGSGKPSDAAHDYLSMLTGSPAAVLQQVADWLEEQFETGGARLALLQAADDRLEPVRAEIETDHDTHRRLGTKHKLLLMYCERFARAYAHVARKLPASHADRPLAVLRAVHLFSRACRLARMTGGEPAELHKAALTLFLDAQQQGNVSLNLSPYPGWPKTSVKQELAVALLWDTAPFDTLTLEQTEYFERFVVSCGSQIILKTAPGSITTYALLADGRIVTAEQAGDAGVVFFGHGPLAGMLAGMLKLPDTAFMPDWAGNPLPHTDLQTIKTLAQRVTATWEGKRMARRSERVERRDQVRVTGGFDNIRRAVAYAAYVRGGGQLKAYDTREKVLTERMREVMVGLEKNESQQLTPIEVLTAMEGASGSNAVEAWTVHDSSAQGYSLAVPGFRGWLAVGSLLAIRETDRIDWSVAIVRRLFGPPHARHAGIEIIPGTPVPVGIGDEGLGASASLADLRDAILIGREAECWLVTTFSCTPGSCCLVSGQHGRALYRVTARSHGDPDYQLYSCVPVERSD